MGMYLNPGVNGFRDAVNSDIFVDKTAMLRYLNSVVYTKQKYVCVSRPRRFGKTMAVDMLCAYYGRGGDSSRSLFDGLKITRTDPVVMRTGEERPWNAFLGSFDVVRVTMTEFIKSDIPMERSLARMQRLVVRELRRAYPEADLFDESDLAMCMQEVFLETGRSFVVAIDEWDAPMRERRDDTASQRMYLDYLRDWLKDKPWLALAYITGILPVKKYGKHSALNMFDEYSMVAPLQLAEFTGFTATEVRGLCNEWGRSFQAMRDWYDGYEVTGTIPRGADPKAEEPRLALYSPLSVVKAMRSGVIGNYWNHTETYRALEEHIRMNFYGLKAAVALMMDGGRVAADLSSYQNDMSTFNSRDDVIALLIHLGYLGWDARSCEAFVPNREVMDVFRTSTKTPTWNAAFAEYETSKELLQKTIACDEAAVAQALERAHNSTDNKSYNSEAALSFAVRLAYYAAQRWYTVLPELDSGKGYADVAYIPSPKRPDLPALVVELKWDQDAKTALDQIRNREYTGRLAHYEGNMLLVGISYNAHAKAGSPDFKRHTCKIEHA